MSDEKVVLEYSDIIGLIPHRPPFLLVDRVDSIVKHESGRGIKAITSTEPHLVGHFPGFPIMPGVLIIEAITQTACIVAAYSSPEDTKDKHVYFTSLDNAKFRSPARPGDTLYMDVRMLTKRGTFFKFEGTAKIEDRAVASAQFSAMIVEPGQ